MSLSTPIILNEVNLSSKEKEDCQVTEAKYHMTQMHNKHKEGEGKDGGPVPV